MTCALIALGHSVRPEFRDGSPIPTRMPFSPLLLIACETNGHWEVAPALEGKLVQCLAADPLHPERVYCGTQDQGLWISDDTGATWRPAGDGITVPAITSIAVSTREQGDTYSAVYVGTEPSAIFRSVDGGMTWAQEANLLALPSSSEWSFPPRPHTHHVRCIGLDVHDLERQYACIEAGAFLRGFAGGSEWEDRRPGSPRDTHTLATHPRAPHRLYAAAGDGFLRPGFGYAESHDAGETWQYLSGGLDHHYLYGMAVDLQDPDTIIISAADSPEAAHNPHAADAVIYYKTANTRWQQAKEGLPPSRGTTIPILTASPTEPGVFYAASNHGLFRSEDGGDRWAQQPLPWQDGYRYGHVHALVMAD